MTTLFLSDVHVDDRHPQIGDQLVEFLHGEARHAEALYVLGDLFEAWVGDDDSEPHKLRVVRALGELSRAGVACHFMAGNRDFLTGEVFHDRSGCVPVEDPTVIELYGRRVLLTHGDTLCTDDTEYQAFRRMVRDPDWQQHFLEMPLAHREAMARQARDASRAHTGDAPMEIMDVNPAAVRAAMREHDVEVMVHGHTHRPGVHRFELDGREAIRIVLGDWYEQGSVLRWSPEGYELSALAR